MGQSLFADPLDGRASHVEFGILEGHCKGRVLRCFGIASSRGQEEREPESRRRRPHGPQTLGEFGRLESIGQRLHEGGEHEPIVERSNFFEELRLPGGELVEFRYQSPKFDRGIDGDWDVEAGRAGRLRSNRCSAAPNQARELESRDF